MAEKDRFGDKLKDKGKAEEDRYFAEQDKRSLEAMRESGEPEPTLGLCPRCSTRLEEKTLSDVAIDECGSCGGIWLDKGELEVIAERAGEGWMSRWVRSVLDSGS